MKAIVMNAYGGAEVLELKEVDKPEIKETDVLVRQKASSLNAGDYFSMHGSPWLTRMSVGFPKPKDYILGWDVAGTVEEVGANVSKVKLGDTVFGLTSAALAEFARVSENNLALIPANFTFEQAATLPSAANTALLALRNQVNVQPGQEVLVNGASGGVGTFSVQIAKALGAEVTGVCSTRNVEMVRSLGADHVIDYTQEDFTKQGKHYDLLLDNVGNQSFVDCRRVLKPGGIHLPNTGHGGMSFVIKAYIFSALMKQHKSPFLAEPAADDFQYLKELCEDGKITPVIDRTYPLSETVAAMHYLEEEHAQGKVVITM